MPSPKLVLIFGTLAVCVMCLYPPYSCVGISPQHRLPLQEGYYPLYSPPQNQNFNTGRSAYAIAYQLDVYRLSGQIIITMVTTIGIASLVYALKQQ